MNLNTKYFGNITYTDEEIVHFPDGLFGFEHLTEYLPISFHPNEDSLISLQSIKDETIAFVLINPFDFFDGYSPHLQARDLTVIDSPKEEDISYYVICVMKDNMEQSTANLKCPIIVNSITRRGKQVVLDTSEYTFRHSLINITKKEA